MFEPPSIYEREPMAVSVADDGSDCPVHPRHKLACWKINPQAGPSWNGIQAQKLANAERVVDGWNNLTLIERLAIELVAAEHTIREYERHLSGPNDGHQPRSPERTPTL